MIDDLIRFCLEEIAYEGELGKVLICLNASSIFSMHLWVAKEGGGALGSNPAPAVANLEPSSKRSTRKNIPISSSLPILPNQRVSTEFLISL